MPPDPELPTAFSRCFERMPAFGLPLVLLSFLINLLAFRNTGFSLLRRVLWVDFIVEFRIRCPGHFIVPLRSDFIGLHSSRVSSVLPLVLVLT